MGVSSHRQAALVRCWPAETVLRAFSSFFFSIRLAVFPSRRFWYVSDAVVSRPCLCLSSSLIPHVFSFDFPVSWSFLPLEHQMASYCRNPTLRPTSPPIWLTAGKGRNTERSQGASRRKGHKNCDLVLRPRYQGTKKPRNQENNTVVQTEGRPAEPGSNVSQWKGHSDYNVRVSHQHRPRKRQKCKKPL